MNEMKFKLSMLEYSKIILSKILFDRKLFIKEYKKAFRDLGRTDRVALKKWVREIYLRADI
jgi:hypothetical protein